MSSYNTIGGEEEGTLLTRPLFGQQSLWRKVTDWASFGVTGMLTLVTFLGAIFKSDVDTVHTKSYNIYFALCLALLCASHFLLLIWYRQGDVDPKFRYLIFSNTVLIILLNVCADLYIFAL